MAVVQKADIAKLVEIKTFAVHLVIKLKSTSCLQVVACLNGFDYSIGRVHRHVMCHLSFLVEARIEAYCAEVAR